MGLYLRKGINFGPLRLNLSKSGFGLSAGIKGARVSLGPRGAMVHAGRGGLYYRKSLTGGRGRRRTRGPAVPTHKQTHYVLTGVRYPRQLPALPETPELSPPKGRPGRALATTGAGLGILTWGVPLPYAVLAGATSVLGCGWLGLAWRRRRHYHRAKNWLHAHEQTPPPPAAVDTHLQQAGALTPAVRQWYLAELGELALARRMLARIQNAPAEAHAWGVLADAVYRTWPAGTQTWQALLQQVLHPLLHTLLADHVLNASEAEALDELFVRYGGDRAMLAPESAIINTFTQAHAEARALAPVEADIRLKRHEVCYHVTAGRILVQRVLKRRRRRGIKHKFVGLHCQREGRLYLTERRLLVLGDGSYEIRLNKILELESEPQQNLIGLNIDGRKSSLFLSVPDTPVLLAKLQRLWQEA